MLVTLSPPLLCAYFYGACRKLTSPRIARLLDAFIWVNEDGFAYLCVVMELADGPNLWDHVRHAFSAGLPEDTARYVAVCWTLVSTSPIIRLCLKIIVA